MISKIRYYHVIAFVVYLLLGSFLVFYGVNCFFTNVVNYENNLNFPFLFATLPWLFLSIEIATSLIFFVRLLRMDNSFRSRHIKVYAVQFFIYSLLGVIFSIVGMIVHKNMLFNNPFPGVLLVLIVVHLLICGASVFAFMHIKKNPLSEKEERFTYTKSYGFKTAGLGILTFFALNRFGAFLQSFFYMEYAYFFFTILFYLSLISPLLMLIAFANPSLGIKSEKNYFKQELIVWCSFLVFNLITALYVIIVGLTNPLLISLVSAAMPLERLITFPIDAIMLYSLNILFPIIRIIYLYRKEKLVKQ